MLTIYGLGVGSLIFRDEGQVPFNLSIFGLGAGSLTFMD